MQFPSPLIPGKLQKRYKRFLADVTLENGQTVVAHCPNTGAMTGCAEPGYQVWLSPSNNPKRKLAYTWELAVNNQQQWIGINTHNANKLVAEALSNHAIPPLSGYTRVKPEVTYGEEGSRIDFRLTDDNGNHCWVEVKSVTLLEGNTGLFPDAKTARGSKHLRELMRIAASGQRAVLLFCAQHTGVEQISVAADIDPVYAETLAQAMAQGVEVVACGCQISKEKVEINQILPFKL